MIEQQNGDIPYIALVSRSQTAFSSHPNINEENVVWLCKTNIAFHLYSSWLYSNIIKRALQIFTCISV